LSYAPLAQGWLERMIASPVGQSGMMARDTIGANQRWQTVCCWCQLLDFAGASGGMVRARSFAGYIILKFTAVFSEIVEQSN
jgi:hypothetical protein